jgi:hypothetical protein
LSCKNRQAQYSRKDNLRFFGIREQNNENSKEEVCKVVDGRLNVRIAPADISAVHRLPKSEKQKFKPTIVRFKDRTQRMEVLGRY